MGIKINKSMAVALMSLSVLPLVFVNCSKNALTLQDQYSTKTGLRSNSQDSVVTTQPLEHGDDSSEAHDLVDVAIGTTNESDSVAVGNQDKGCNKGKSQVIVNTSYDLCDQVIANQQAYENFVGNHLLQAYNKKFVISESEQFMANNVRSSTLLISQVKELKLVNLVKNTVTCAKADLVQHVSNYEGHLHIIGNVKMISNFQGHLIVEGDIGILTNFKGQLEVSGKINKKINVQISK